MLTLFILHTTKNPKGVVVMENCKEKTLTQDLGLPEKVQKQEKPN